MKFPRDRVGIYKQQKREYKTFVPKPLPPSPPLDLDIKILNLLSRADQALGRLDGVAEVLPNPDLFVMMYVKKEAVLSSQIEGTQASLLDVLEFEAKALDPHKPTEAKEVVNYIKAINYGVEQIKEGKKISLSLIKKIHYYLLEGIRGGAREPGKIRTIQNWIGPPGGNITDALFIPPDVNDMKKALKDLELFIRKEDDLPPLIKAGLVHSQFETIHPFLDGNGRIGRLLITLLLTRSQHLSRPLLYLSYYFKQNRTEYYERLQAVRDKGEWESWLSFFLNGMYHASTDAIRTSMRILELRKEKQELISEKLGKKSGSALKLLDELFNRPLVTVNSIIEITALSYPNANRLASIFGDLGLLKEITGQKRNRIYEFVEYMDILNGGI
ncbi:MAG: Fic family protein [Candidatus Heimdallarchaeota archaeon]|nr:MAG: Fic family protein [Candidatus Heimdallarchaeota archaeon]